MTNSGISCLRAVKERRMRAAGPPGQGVLPHENQRTAILMEPFNAGWLSIVPPIVAIALALITKEVLSSLVLGILTGTLIYTIGMDGNVLMGTLESAFTVMGSKARLQHPDLLLASRRPRLRRRHVGRHESLRQLGRQAHQGPQERPGSHHGSRRRPRSSSTTTSTASRWAR